VLSKLSRLRHGGSPRVLDLFAGCGGLSLGFEAAGFEIAAAVEFDRDAAASHGANFHPADQADFERHGKAAPFRANDELLALQPACCLTLSRSLDEARADGS